jgi:hypothetical protein
LRFATWKDSTTYWNTGEAEINNGSVKAIKYYTDPIGGNQYYAIGGNFTDIAPTNDTCNGLFLFNLTTATYDPVGGSLTILDSGADVNTIVKSEIIDNLYAGGDFTTGTFTNCISWQTTTPASIQDESLPDPVYSILPTSAGLLVGSGTNFVVNGTPYSGDPPFSAPPEVVSMSLVDGRVFMATTTATPYLYIYNPSELITVSGTMISGAGVVLSSLELPTQGSIATFVGSTTTNRWYISSINIT